MTRMLRLGSTFELAECLWLNLLRFGPLFSKNLFRQTSGSIWPMQMQNFKMLNDSMTINWYKSAMEKFRHLAARFRWELAGIGIKSNARIELQVRGQDEWDEPVGPYLSWGWLIGWKSLLKCISSNMQDWVYTYCWIGVSLRTICKTLLVLLSYPPFLSSSRAFLVISVLSCPESPEICKV